MSCKEIKIEVDSFSIFKYVSELDQQERQGIWLQEMCEASERVAKLYREERWTDIDLFDEPEKWIEYIKKQPEFKFLKAKVVFL